MTEPTTHAHTKSGRPITDPEIENLAADAEAEGTTTSELIREALRRYLRAA